MITDKQKRFLRSLLIEAGLLNPRYDSFSGGAKRLPHGPTMRERSQGFDAWASRLTKRQASEVISYLLSNRGN